MPAIAGIFLMLAKYVIVQPFMRFRRVTFKHEQGLHEGDLSPCYSPRSAAPEWVLASAR